ncbi:MAG TPA: class I SAM-dependent methyltransferase [Chitinophagaceae bacterium]
MEIRYAQGINAWKDFHDNIHQFILAKNVKDIAEIGGGANPLLSVEFIEEHELNYHVIDISADELSKADPRYKKIMLDIEKKDIGIPGQYELVFSQLTAEHIKDIQSFYRNVFKLLKPGGSAYFFFACVTTLPTFLNYILPEFISKAILLVFQPFRKNEKHGKFTAYYKWCVGPTRKNIRRFESLRFEIAVYTGYFGHSYYQRIGLLNRLEKIKTNFLLKHPNPNFCSYSHLLLGKQYDEPT